MSLQLEYNSTIYQTIILTLSESITGNTESGLTFHIVFKSENTDVETAVDITDISLYPSRYNEFLVNTTLSTGYTENIPFPISGWYEYKAYKDSTLDLILEIGKIYVVSYTPIDNNYSIDSKGYTYTE